MESFDEITPIFEKLSHKPTHRDVEDALPILERFTVLLNYTARRLIVYQPTNVEKNYSAKADQSIPFHQQVELCCNMPFGPRIFPVMIGIKKLSPTKFSLIQKNGASKWQIVATHLNCLTFQMPPSGAFSGIVKVVISQWYFFKK